MGALHEALELRPSADGSWSATADHRFEAINGMFGGWTAAVLLQSMIQDPACEGAPLALTVNYLHTVPPEAEVRLTARRVGGGRSVHHWQAELHPPDSDIACATATAVFGVRRSTDGFIEPTMPPLPPLDGLPVFHPPGSWGQRAEVRPIRGHFEDGALSDTTSLSYVREISGRALDQVQLALLSDAYAPRNFFITGEPRISSTLTMSVHFHATDAELAEVADDYIVNEAIGTRAVDGVSGQQARLWSRQGHLLATTEQICWYR